MANPPRIALMIPYYNHERTLRAVVQDVLAILDAQSSDVASPEVLVVDDGSAVPAAELLEGLDRARVLRFERNQGKGAAILAGAAWARDAGATHLLTLDADGQHDAADIPAFLAAVQATPFGVLVGARDFATPTVPRSSRVGRAFSNFWLRVQTGVALGDRHSGFRV
jgi:glycosyltransferase involved in cell wall biosynthesis